MLLTDAGRHRILFIVVGQWSMFRTIKKRRKLHRKWKVSLHQLRRAATLGQSIV